MKIFLFLIAVILLPVRPAFAQLFKYKDDQGVLHAVDSEEAIPEKYRKISQKLGGETSRGHGGTCQGKKMCGVIFLASHCPVCKLQQPTHKAWLENNSPSKEFGLKAIVGFARRAGQNEEFAKGLGERGVAVDNDGAMAKRMNITTYPKYLVFDADKKLVYKDNEASDWIQKNFGAPPPPGGNMPMPNSPISTDSFAPPPGGVPAAATPAPPAP